MQNKMIEMKIMVMMVAVVMIMMTLTLTTFSRTIDLHLDVPLWQRGLGGQAVLHGRTGRHAFASFASDGSYVSFGFFSLNGEHLHNSLHACTPFWQRGLGGQAVLHGRTWRHAFASFASDGSYVSFGFFSLNGEHLHNSLHACTPLWQRGLGGQAMLHGRTGRHAFATFASDGSFGFFRFNGEHLHIMMSKNEGYCRAAFLLFQGWSLGHGCRNSICLRN
jgi:hypothetical protein